MTESDIFDLLPLFCRSHHFRRSGSNGFRDRDPAYHSGDLGFAVAAFEFAHSRNRSGFPDDLFNQAMPVGLRGDLRPMSHT